MAGNVLSVGSGAITSGNETFYLSFQIRQPTANATTGAQARFKVQFYNDEQTETVYPYITVTISIPATSQFAEDFSASFTVSTPSNNDSGWTNWYTLTGLTHSTSSQTYAVHYNMSRPIKSIGTVFVTGQIYWESGGGSTTYTKCLAPTIVRVGANSGNDGYRLNQAVYNTTAPTPGQFYITWNAGSAGTGTSISGYTRRAQNTLGGTPYTETTSSSVRYDRSYNWTTTAVGYSYKCDVKTLSSVSGYDSDWSTSYGTVVFSASAVNSTLKLDPNGGKINNSTSVYSLPITLGQQLDLPVPTRKGYIFNGWYYNSTSSDYMDLGSYFLNQGSFNVSFWTYASTYDQGTSSKPVSIISCMENGGWGLTCENGTDWAFQFCDSGGWHQVKVAKSSLAAGYHRWCLSFNNTTKKIEMWVDGISKGTANTSATTCSWGSPKKLLVGAELGTSGMASGSGFIGKIGNVVISGDTGFYQSNPTEYMTPGVTTVYTLTADWINARYWYIYQDGTWNEALPYIYNGTKWIKADTYVYNGSTWQ